MSATTDILNQFANQAKALRAKLDAGEIDFNSYIKQATDIRRNAAQHEMALGGSGSGGASLATQYQQGFQSILGLMQDMSEPGVLKYKPVGELSEKYQQQIRDSLLPSNITGDERDRLLKDIPNDIEYGSDRYKIEQEGIRQRIAAEKAQMEAKTRRAQSLSELSQLLSTRNERVFEDSIPDITEAANVKGIYRSTGYGDALARERTRLEAGAQEQLAQQSLSDRELDEQTMAGILAKQQGFQFDALSRDFSNKDYGRQIADAMRIAELSRPQQSRGKAGGGALSGAVGGAGALSSLGPWGAVAGGILGGAGGYFSSRG